MGHFEDWIEPNLYKDYDGKSVLFCQRDEEKSFGKLFNLKAKTIVLMLEDMGVPDNEYKKMILSIMGLVKNNVSISEKQRIALLRAVFY